VQGPCFSSSSLPLHVLYIFFASFECSLQLKRSKKRSEFDDGAPDIQREGWTGALQNKNSKKRKRENNEDEESGGEAEVGVEDKHMGLSRKQIKKVRMRENQEVKAVSQYMRYTPKSELRIAEKNRFD
jgi:hypothetical protein